MKFSLDTYKNTRTHTRTHAHTYTSPIRLHPHLHAREQEFSLVRTANTEFALFLLMLLINRPGLAR